MKFSIIIPAHNAEDRIAETVKSVLLQTFNDYELIVVCDACEDETAKIAKLYTDNVYEINAHNDGAARNKGLDVAQGEWILFLDDDDCFLSDYVFAGIDNLTQKIENLGCNVLITGFFVKNGKYLGPFDNDGKLFPNVWSKVWKRSAIGETRFPIVEAVSDFEFCKLMAKKPTTHYYATDYPMVVYNYMRPGSITERRAHGKA